MTFCRAELTRFLRGCEFFSHHIRVSHADARSRQHRHQKYGLHCTLNWRPARVPFLTEKTSSLWRHELKTRTQHNGLTTVPSKATGATLFSSVYTVSRIPHVDRPYRSREKLTHTRLNAPPLVCVELNHDRRGLFSSAKELLRNRPNHSTVAVEWQVNRSP